MSAPTLLPVFDASLRDARQYWTETFSGRTYVTRLGPPRDGAAADDARSVQTVALVEIGRDLGSRIESLARGAPLLVYSVLLAAAHVVLARYAGTAAVCVSSPDRRRENGSMATARAGLVPVPVEVRASDTFAELLIRVRDGLRAGYRHQSYPYEWLLRDIRVVAPEFSPGVAVRLSDLHEAMPDEWMGVLIEVTRTADGLAGRVTAGASMDQRLAARFAESWRELLESVTTRLSTPLGAIDALGAEERAALVVWNDTARPVAGRHTVADLFEARAASCAARPAVTFGECTLTYAELQSRANRIARHLRERGAGPDVAIGICMPPSIELAVSVLAVLKAGAGYVPLVPDYPPRRLSEMATDSGVSLILCTPASAVQAACAGASLVDIEEVLARVETDRDAQVRARRTTTPEHLAYILYTSGSTGRPKGVEMPHRPLVNLLDWQIRRSTLPEGAATLQAASFGFDVSFQEIFSTWCAGGHLVIAPPHARQDPHLLRDLVRRHHVARLFLPFTALQEFAQAVVDDLDKAGARGAARHDEWPLREIVTAGEQLQITSALSSLLRRMTTTLLDNQYGPTEAHVVTAHALSHSAQAWPSLPPPLPPIGRPIDNAKIWILDRTLNLAPIGTTGDIYISGHCLARGYRRRPALTAAAFVPDPFADAPGARMYRTGDLGRYAEDGSIEYLGRRDHQVKLRGFRIELGEVEAALHGVPGVRAAAAAVRDWAGRPHLAGYIVRHASGRPLPRELRAVLQDRLPGHMVPTAFMFVDDLPTTTSGKLDRAQLPPLDAAAFEGDLEHVEPRTAIERTLAGIWRAVLSVPRIGVYDNFFERGGDSILAIQVVSKAAQAGIRITPRAIFESQTIARLAATARDAAAGVTGDVSDSGGSPLTPIQHWFFDAEQPEAHHYTMANIFRLAARVRARDLETCWAAILREHAALRSRFVRTPHGWTHEIDAHVRDSGFTIVDLTGVPAGARTALIEETCAAAQRALDLSRGPIVRALVFELGAGEGCRLFIVAHHLVFDAVSWRIVIDDLQLALRQREEGQPLALPLPTTPWRVWAERLRAHASSPDVLAELPFWREMASHPAPPPHARPDAKNLEATTVSAHVSLGEADTREIVYDLPGRCRARIDEVLLTALGRAYGEWAGDDTLRIDLESHGRDVPLADLDPTRTIGWFTCLYPVRIPATRTEAPLESLRRVKQAVRAVPNRGLGFGLLRYHGSSETRAALAALPAAGVSFNYFGQFDQQFPADGLIDVAAERPGPTVSPLAPRRHVLYVSGYQLRGEIHFTFRYSTDVFDAATIDRLMQAFERELRGIMTESRHAAPALESSDFAQAGLGAGQLARAIEQTRIAGWPAGDGRAIEDVLPLSPAQEGMLSRELLDTDRAAYPVLITFRTTKTDIDALLAAWQTVVDRHAALRTAIVWERIDRPVRMVARSARLGVERLDWRDRAPETCEADLEAYIDAQASRPFPMQAAPMMRLAAIQLAEDRVAWVWSYPHILLDGWSTFVVFRDLIRCYRAARAGAAPSLPPVTSVPSASADISSSHAAECESFWRAVLAGYVRPFRVADERRGETTRQLAEWLALTPEAEAERIEAFARANRLTSNIVLAGAYTIALARWRDLADVVIGTTVSGRSSQVAHAEDAVGMFINVLPFRARVPEKGHVVEWLRGLQDQQVRARAFEQTPLTRILRWSQLPRGAALFDTILTFENYPIAAEVHTTEDLVEPGSFVFRSENQFPLTLIVDPRMSLRWVYDRTAVDGRALEHLREDLARLLDALCRGPNVTFDDLWRIDMPRTASGAGAADASLEAAVSDTYAAPLDLSELQLVELAALDAGAAARAVTPLVDGVDLVEWAEGHRSLVDGWLASHGALLFRGFDIASSTQFETLAAALCTSLYADYGDLPRSQEGQRVYSSTPFPSTQRILFHNESSHLSSWPARILFYCVQPSATGGATPIVDCRALYHRLDRAVREEFERRKLRYVRNFIPGMDVPWQQFFGTGDREEVENACRRAGMEWEWRGDGLRTWQVREAVRRHPVTGEPVFFNQILLHHQSCLAPDLQQALSSLYDTADLPRHVFYGDGGPIDAAVVRHVLEVSDEIALRIPWEQGDVMLLDNVLTSHARDPYSGARKILVALGDLTGD